MSTQHVDHPPPSVAFPSGRHFALTWGIPDQFGGMTAALLHRSRAFSRWAGVSVDVLTLEERADGAEVEATLRREGQLLAESRLINLWDWLREHDVAPRGPVAHTHDALSPDPADEELRAADGVVLRRERQSSDSTGTVQIDRYRRDGGLLVTDRRSSPLTGGRRVVLYDRDGTAVRSWSSVWGLYRFWLDQLFGSDEVCVIVDSKTAARFVHTYRRSNVVTMHVVHGSHRGAGSEAGRLRASRLPVLEHLDDYDGIVLLTHAQLDDLRADLGDRPHLCVIPNGVDLGAADPALAAAEPPRPRGNGVMLASLTARKRVGHAIAAVAAASASAEVTLEVFGEGEERARLERTIGQADAQEIVRLHGHDARARDRFATADFTVLTSSSEGLPLVLAEAMAAGCIPVAYDIAYGPADLIEHGRNGFLVAAGDIDALAARLVDLRRLPDEEVERIRRRARETARRFDDRSVTQAWAENIERARQRKRSVATPAALPRWRRGAARLRGRLLRLLRRRR